jgi:hypothetical protein
MFGAEFVEMKQGMEAMAARPMLHSMNDGSSTQWDILYLW